MWISFISSDTHSAHTWFVSSVNQSTFGNFVHHLQFLVNLAFVKNQAGVIGRCVYRKSMQETKLVRISGLDPAFPSFFPSMGTKPVNKNDAEFVDIIHTDAWFYGAPKSTGTVDFWPNGGHTLQVIIKTFVCCHTTN